MVRKRRDQGPLWAILAQFDISAACSLDCSGLVVGSIDPHVGIDSHNLIVLTYCRVTHSYARLSPAVLY